MTPFWQIHIWIYLMLQKTFGFALTFTARWGVYFRGVFLVVFITFFLKMPKWWTLPEKHYISNSTVKSNITHYIRGWSFSTSYRDNIKTDLNQMNENLNETSIQNALTMVPQVELFSFVFWKNWRHQKDILNLTDL